MNKIILALVGLAFTGIIYLAIAERNAQEIRTEIEIAASPSKVWSILIDIKQWPDWNPTVKRTKGTVSLGSKVDVTMVGREKRSEGAQYNPIIMELVEAKYFHWRAHMMAEFLFTNDKVFELEETETGTRLIHKELFSGLLAPVFYEQLEKGVPVMLNSMNEALKKLAEE